MSVSFKWTILPGLALLTYSRLLMISSILISTSGLIIDALQIKNGAYNLNRLQTAFF